MAVPMAHDYLIPDAPAPSSTNGWSLPIPYTAEEVGRNFAALLATFNFRTEFHNLGIGSLSFLKRVQAKRLLVAICIALWHIALEKSFPNDADDFFSRFIETYPDVTGSTRRARLLREAVDKYNVLIAEKKDSDFTIVAETLTADLKIHKRDRRRQQLRISLRIRNIYDLIFNHLI